MTGVEKLLKGRTLAEVAAALSQADKRTCSRQLIQYWREQGCITPKWALTVHRVYGIPLHELNPEVYPRGMSN